MRQVPALLHMYTRKSVLSTDIAFQLNRTWACQGRALGHPPLRSPNFTLKNIGLIKVIFRLLTESNIIKIKLDTIE